MRSTSEDRSAITTAVRHAREALKKALWGAALATIGVLPAGLWWFGLLAHNFRAKLLSTPLLRTFASPRVGDPVFATNFNQIGITSWRIVNELDVVPNLPFLSFEHIQTLHLYNSASSCNGRWSAGIR
jgi:predicted lipase